MKTREAHVDVNSGQACHQGASRLSGKANLLKILQSWRKITDRISFIELDREERALGLR